MTHTPPLPRGGTYLVCVDASAEARIALTLACKKAVARGGRVVMLHIMPPVDFQSLGGVAERMREERKKEAETLLSDLALYAEHHHHLRPECALREGATGEEIIAYAMALETIIMIVLGTHGGRGKLVAWLAAQLGGKLLVPLLMVPGNVTEAQLDQLV